MQEEERSFHLLKFWEQEAAQVHQSLIQNHNHPWSFPDLHADLTLALDTLSSSLRCMKAIDTRPTEELDYSLAWAFLSECNDRL